MPIIEKRMYLCTYMEYEPYLLIVVKKLLPLFPNAHLPIKRRDNKIFILHNSQ